MATLSTPVTTVAFYEMAGSPQEKYTAEGFQAQRRFLVAWEKRAEFVQNIMGNASRFDYRLAAYYPERPSVFPTSITVEPAEENNVERQTLRTLHTDLNSYRGSWARITVDYTTVNDTTDIEDSPDAESGTNISYRLSYESLEEEIPADGWVWSDATSSSLPNDAILVKRVPQSVHQLVWRKVVSPPWTAIRSTQGKINQSTFLGCAPGTLLFEGVLTNKLYRSTFEEGESPFTWAITYTFRCKTVSFDGNTYGWNAFFRATDGTWAIPQNGDARLYDEADFAPLFQSE